MIVIRPIRQTHLFQQCSAGCFDGCVAFAAMLFCQQFAGQRDILQAVYCGKRLKFWNTSLKWSRLVRMSRSYWAGLSSALKIVVPATEIEPPSGFSKVEAPQQRGLAARRRR